MRHSSRHTKPGAFLHATLSTMLLVLCMADGTLAKDVWTVKPEGVTLAETLSRANPGDIIQISPGIYPGPLAINKPVKLTGKTGAIIDGKGTSRVITVNAPNVIISGLEIRGSGSLLRTEDSGIFITQKAANTVIKENIIRGNLIGVYLKGPENAHILNNTIIGRDDLRMNERGNGIQLWNTPGSIIEGNIITKGRDGIFVTTSKRNRFINNKLSNVRFAIHYMYTNESEVSGNISYKNHLGYAIMYSKKIKVHNNISDHDRDHGILLNYANRSEFKNNKVINGPNKCVFIYNANKNSFRNNHFEGCNIGVHFTAGSERNIISGNSFINNRNQIKYVGTRHIEWSEKGKGNYWSDNLSFDLNGDGVADAPYKPNGVADQILWRHPSAKLLMSSPALQLLRWTQSAFPALYPGGVTDSSPLMQPVSAHNRTGTRHAKQSIQ